MRKLSDIVLNKTLVGSLISDREGVTAIEYGLIAGIIAVGIVATLTLLNTNLTSLFSTVSTSLSGA